MRDITEKQSCVLRFIHVFLSQHEYPPCIREIGDQFEISSLRGVTVHLDALQRKGYIDRKATARAIRITAFGKRALGIDATRPTFPLTAVIERLVRERDEHYRVAAILDSSTSPNAIKRLRYTAGVLQSLADEFTAKYLTTEENQG